MRLKNTTSRRVLSQGRNDPICDNDLPKEHDVASRRVLRVCQGHSIKQQMREPTSESVREGMTETYTL